MWTDENYVFISIICWARFSDSISKIENWHQNARVTMFTTNCCSINQNEKKKKWMYVHMTKPSTGLYSPRAIGQVTVLAPVKMCVSDCKSKLNQLNVGRPKAIKCNQNGLTERGCKCIIDLPEFIWLSIRQFY